MCHIFRLKIWIIYLRKCDGIRHIQQKCYLLRHPPLSFLCARRMSEMISAFQFHHKVLFYSHRGQGCESTPVLLLASFLLSWGHRMSAWQLRWMEGSSRPDIPPRTAVHALAPRFFGVGNRGAEWHVSPHSINVHHIGFSIQTWLHMVFQSLPQAEEGAGKTKDLSSQPWTLWR